MHAEDFPSTRWSLIAAAGAAPEPDHPAVDLVARIYRPAVLAWLVHGLKLKREDAEDVFQSFIADKLGGDVRRILTIADPTRGQFRSLLVAAVQRHAIDRQRASSAVKRSGAARKHRPPSGSSINTLPAPDLFERVWAERVISETVRLTQDECRRSDRHELWDIFNARILMPAMDGLAPEPHEQLARRLKLSGAGQCSNLLITAKRMFARNLRTVVTGYTDDPSQVDREMDALWAIFSRRRA